MTIETDVKQRLAALRATLAGATMACPGHISDDCGHNCGLCPCEGTCGVARFPGFRQPCGGHLQNSGGTTWAGKPRHKKCRLLGDCNCTACDCNGTGWQVRAGGMADALAGLTLHEQVRVVLELYRWFVGHGNDDPAATGSEINAKTLELACLETNLIRPCLRHGGTDWAGGPTCSECEALGGYVVCEAAGLEAPPACAS